jgi:hypothetical protein
MVDYSTVEQETGRRWIDGKMIFQKTLNATTTVGASTWGFTGLVKPIGLTNIIEAKCVYVPSGTGGTYSTCGDFRIRSHDMGVWAVGGVDASSIITIWYTK